MISPWRALPLRYGRCKRCTCCQLCQRLSPQKVQVGPSQPQTNISLLRLRLIIFEVVCGINPIEPLLLVPNKWMEHGNTWKMATSVDAPQKKTKRVQKVHLGIQLDMASQRCLVADCGFCVATSALAPLASRRGKNWKSECRPDMIRMIENYKFLMFFLDPCESRRGRNAHFHFWVTRLPIEMNAHVANIFWRLLQIPAFCLLASKIRISNSSPLQGCRVNWLPCFSQFPISLIWTLSWQQESQADPAPTEAAMAPKLLRMISD